MTAELLALERARATTDALAAEQQRRAAALEAQLADRSAELQAALEARPQIPPPRSCVQLAREGGISPSGPPPPHRGVQGLVQPGRLS